MANHEAFKKHTRFIDADLNRVFPGKKNGNKEEKIAFKLAKQFKSYDVVLDFHTATDPCELFIITTNLSPKHIKFINTLNVKKVVYMENSLALGHSLIDYVELGVSVEVGGRVKNMEIEIKSFIEDYLKGIVKGEKEYYTVFEILKKEEKTEKLSKNIKPFKLVKKGEEISAIGNKKRYAEVDFYPVLAREKNYQGVLCLMARRLNMINLRRKI